jgi:hypothetical protein
MALAAFLRAIFNLLLPLGVLLDSNFPPLILLFGVSLSHEVKCFAVSNFSNPSGHTSLIIDKTVECPNPYIAIKSTPPKY